MSDSEHATVTVNVTREVQIPVDLVGDDDPSSDELADRTIDWFWNHWSEALANEPAPAKDNVVVSCVALPKTDGETDG